ncbi:uncharacterized protein EV422DRAFT_23632 [Fimicolochytrium jonesii]|uniref:uncharacterized protein n=1 Tax=Fimicolochytrium jonesii TaxID=1396493 RepID=UPI0022FDFC20|nr:uncharacterized protein EV422DRAFT_23632 [Fimicolochytrium jonesii]KAI8827056.1 hypothetical protein EV422DRAFT_23632 [Fimicolochytrium jonesii]
MSQPATMKSPKLPTYWGSDVDTMRKPGVPIFSKTAAHVPPRPKVPNGYTTLAGAVCHGRVSDLEAMVPSQWWQTVFADSMYLKTDGDVVEDPQITKEEVGLLQSDVELKSIFERGLNKAAAGTRPARVLDLCCGQGRHILHLAQEYPYLSLHGHDQSSYLISLAQERAAAQQMTTKTAFTVGDCRQVPYPDRTFDLVMVMGNSFGYFADEDGDRTVLSEIFRVLAPGGRIVLDLTDGDYMRHNFAERSWEWIDDTTFVCRERQLSKDGLRLSSREVVTLTTKGVIRDQFYQERLYGREELQELFKRAGFEVQENKTDLDPITLGKDLSKRKEDLGMMEQRVLMTGKKPFVKENLHEFGKKLSNGVHHMQHKPNGVRHHINGAVNGFHPNGHINGTHKNAAARSISIESTTEDGKVLPAPFERITVLLGDPALPCIGKLNDTWNPEDIETRKKLFNALHELGYPPDAITVLDRHETFVRQLSDTPPLFVLNLCDEGFENDALKELHVPALLDLLNIPYSGAGANCLAHCYDKGLVNRTAAAIGVPTPKEIFYATATATPAVQSPERLHEIISREIGYPAFIKPVKGDNSLGITTRSIVNNETELDTYMAELGSKGIRDIIVQEYLEGAEYGVGMVGNRETGFHFFPILEVDYSRITAKSLPPILGFESKWDPSSPYWTDITYKRASGLSDELVKQLHEWCVALSDRFGCRDYARFDFRADKADGTGTIKLLEVNPNPGWCWDGKLAYMGKLEGLQYHDVLGMVLKAAWQRLNHPSATTKGSTPVTYEGSVPLDKSEGPVGSRVRNGTYASAAQNGHQSSARNGSNGAAHPNDGVALTAE